jgi:hypothetical protein
LTTRIERSGALFIAEPSLETSESNALPWISDQVRDGNPDRTCHTQDQRFFLAHRLGRTLPRRACARLFGILSRCQLPRPNCQRTQTNRGGGGRIRSAFGGRSGVPNPGQPPSATEIRKVSRSGPGRQAA